MSDTEQPQAGGLAELDRALHHAQEDLESVEFALDAEINEDVAPLRAAYQAAFANLGRARAAYAQLVRARAGIVEPAPTEAPARHPDDDAN